jgi:hypothetical protein
MSTSIRDLPILPTTVIGSLPRPAWLLDVLQEYLAGRVPRTNWDRACDRAIPFAVALQETAGIDVISDGEWRREGYFQVFNLRSDRNRMRHHERRHSTPPYWPRRCLRREAPLGDDRPLGRRPRLRPAQ